MHDFTHAGTCTLPFSLCLTIMLSFSIMVSKNNGSVLKMPFHQINPAPESQFGWELKAGKIHAWKSSII